MLIDRMALSAASPTVYGHRRGYANIISDLTGDTTYILPRYGEGDGDTVREGTVYARLSNIITYRSSSEFMEVLLAGEDSSYEDYVDDDDDERSNYAMYAVDVPCPALSDRGEEMTVDQITDVSQVLRSALAGADTATYVAAAPGFLTALDNGDYIIIRTKACPETETTPGCTYVGSRWYTPTSFTSHSLNAGDTIPVKEGEVIAGNTACAVVGSSISPSTGIAGYVGVAQRAISRAECSGSLLLAAHRYKRYVEENLQLVAAQGTEISSEMVSDAVARVAGGSMSAARALTLLGVPSSGYFLTSTQSGVDSAARATLEEANRVVAGGGSLRSGNLTSVYIMRLCSLVPNTRPDEQTERPRRTSTPTFGGRVPSMPFFEALTSRPVPHFRTP